MDNYKDLINLTDERLPQENQTDRGMFDDCTDHDGFVDLRPMMDDKTVLKNPHKGWFWHYIDNGIRAGAYRDHNIPEEYIKNFPGMNHLYLRFDWADVEKEKGKYDFSCLDEIMEKWGKLGFTFSMRAVAYESAPCMEFATPRYVFQEGAKCFKVDDCAIQPDYGDPIFLERLEAFMEAWGKKYNGDKRLELVDIGTYGTWGEGHTVAGDGHIYDVDTVLKHFQLHEKYFPDTILVANDDHIVGRIPHGQKEVQDMLNYCAARGYGLQDDSICCDGYTQDMAYDTMRAPWAFQKLAKNAPNVIEFAHYRYIRPEFDCHFRNGFTMIEALRNSCATYAGFHGYPDDWYDHENYLTEYLANRLGYWFFIPYAVVPNLTATAHNAIGVAFENKGFARAYNNYKVKIKLQSDSNVYVKELDWDLKLLGSNEKKVFDGNLDLRDVAPGNYEISIGVFEGDRKVLLALKNEKDGYYKIRNIEVK